MTAPIFMFQQRSGNQPSMFGSLDKSFRTSSAKVGLHPPSKQITHQEISRLYSQLIYKHEKLQVQSKYL